MRFKKILSYLIPAVIILAGGVILSLAAWFAYYGIVSAVEAIFFPLDPMRVPMTLLRFISAIFLSIAAFFIVRSKAHEYIKAIFVLGAMCMFTIATVISLYDTLAIALGIIVFCDAIVIYLLIWYKKPWYYYIAIVYALVLGLLYSWPY